MHNALTVKSKKIIPNLQRLTGFYLAGGTGLALQIGHRISVDFDLFCRKKIPANLLQEVEKAFSDHEVKISVNNPDELTVFIDGIKVTFLYYPFPVYSEFTEIEGLKILLPKEIGYTKAYSIGRRGSYKDYVDLYFLLKDKIIALEDIVKECSKIYGDRFSDRLFLEQLVYMDDVDEIEIKFINSEISKKDIETYFADEVRKFGKTI